MVYYDRRVKIQVRVPSFDNFIHINDKFSLCHVSFKKIILRDELRKHRATRHHTA